MPSTASEAAGLLRWYRSVRRDLPWRRTRDPYRIWVSEVMLQQTRVEAAIPYYQRFLADFPDLEALAAAPLERVLARWSGLGYYDRARSLHAAVRECAERYQGRVPRTPEEFGALPGVGPYTRAAVLSIAYGVPLAVVDGNVVRVLARLRGLGGHARSAALRTAVASAAQELLVAGAAGDFNQALMELGATVCVPRAPRCAECPLASGCHARRSGAPERWPGPAPQKAIKEVAWAVALIERRGRVLLARRAERGRWKGMWELPWAPGRFSDIGPAYGLRIEFVSGEPGASASGSGRTPLRHAVLDERITVRVRAARLVGRLPRAAGRFAWVARDDLAEHALASVWLKVLRSGTHRPSSPAGRDDAQPAGSRRGSGGAAGGRPAARRAGDSGAGA